MLFDLFKKEEKIKQGDCVMLKRTYKKDFPQVPSSLILKIVQIEEEEAVVVFINSHSTDICEERVCIKALYKVN